MKTINQSTQKIFSISYIIHGTRTGKDRFDQSPTKSVKFVTKQSVGSSEDDEKETKRNVNIGQKGGQQQNPPKVALVEFLDRSDLNSIGKEVAGVGQVQDAHSQIEFQRQQTLGAQESDKCLFLDD